MASVLLKNTASQRWRCFAFDTDGPKTGDAANITAKISKDYGALAATNDTNPTELESGYYEFNLTQAETNADVLLLVPVSATSGVTVVGAPPTVRTETPLAGRGADEVTVTIQVGGVPQDDCAVWITSDEAGETVVAGTLRTNASGQATFLLDDGSSYYLWAEKTGMNPIKGRLFTATAD